MHTKIHTNNAVLFDNKQGLRAVNCCHKQLYIRCLWVHRSLFCHCSIVIVVSDINLGSSENILTCLKKFHRRSGRVPVLSYSSTIYIYQTFLFSMTWTIFLWSLSDILKNILNLKAFFRKANIRWHQRKTMRIVRFYAQLKD